MRINGIDLMELPNSGARKLIVNPHALMFARTKGRELDPMRTGGIMIGRYQDDGTPIVLKCLPMPEDSILSRGTFTRGEHGVQERLKAEARSGNVYVGEWQTVTGYCPDTSPSWDDTCRMLKEMRSGCDPLLLNVGLAADVARFSWFSGDPQQWYIADMERELTRWIKY